MAQLAEGYGTRGTPGTTGHSRRPGRSGLSGAREARSGRRESAGQRGGHDLSGFGLHLGQMLGALE